MRNPQVLTDGSVDTSSLEAIVSGVVKAGMSEEEKALTLYRWFREVVYHYGWPYMRPEREENWQDPIKVINVHGYSLCGSQARVFGRLLSRVFGDENVRLIGFTEAQPGVWRLGEGPGAFVDSARLRDFARIRRMGHSSFEVRYGGRWRLLDPHVGFYAYLRDGSGLASAEDCIADPSLVTRPARVIPGLMPCGDLSRVFWASEFTNWGSIAREAAPDNHVMDIVLRRGDTYTRYWDRRGPFVWFAEMDRRWDPEYLALGPRHLCEGERPWRHYGNGELVYRPPLSDRRYQDGVTFESGLAASSEGLQPVAPRRLGVVAWGTAVPYLVCGGRLILEATRATGSDRLAAWVRPEGGGWQRVWQEVGCGRARRELDISPWVHGRYAFELRLDLVAARRPEHVIVHGLTLETSFVLNYLALPRLRPGENEVTVRVANPAELRQQRLAVTYAWEDGEGEREHTQQIASSPTRYTITVAPVRTTPPESPKYMRYLRLSVD